MNNFLNHPYHLVTMSPWPLILSISLMNLMISILELFFYKNFMLLVFNMFLMLLCMFQWWRDVIRESTFQGMHTINVVKGIYLGMILFIISEVFFFISFFWGFFHMSLSPSIEIGLIWPPKGINSFDPYDIPMLNTVILLSSGVSITWSHNMMVLNKKFSSMMGLLITLVLGLYFSLVQIYEYNELSFSISDSVYGSLFYMMTGFHGIHIIVGSLFLLVSLIRMYSMHFSFNHFFCFEGSIWYWHFVDVVWLFLYLILYWWFN
uniref:Cytochrome c oxidase subunit 3 n=1 Tax=Ampulex compressa TaxID=860918 RepID=A0A343DRL0_AMPCP|nr:cytochrome c oxidase subunit 3 [Ampulex compressa]